MQSDNKDIDNMNKDTLAQMTEMIRNTETLMSYSLRWDLTWSVHRSKTSHDPLLKIVLAEN